MIKIEFLCASVLASAVALAGAVAPAPATAQEKIGMEDVSNEA